MWVATSAAKANFIFDMQADRNSSVPVLGNAQWMADRGEQPPAEFLWLFLSAQGNEERLTALRLKLDPRWLGEVTRRWFRAGDIVQVLKGYWEGLECIIFEVDAREARADVCPVGIFCRRTGPTRVNFSDLILLNHAKEKSD